MNQKFGVDKSCFQSKMDLIMIQSILDLIKRVDSRKWCNPLHLQFNPQQSLFEIFSAQFQKKFPYRENSAVSVTSDN